MLLTSDDADEENIKAATEGAYAAQEIRLRALSMFTFW